MTGARVAAMDLEVMVARPGPHGETELDSVFVQYGEPLPPNATVQSLCRLSVLGALGLPDQDKASLDLERQARLDAYRQSRSIWPTEA